MDYETSCPGGHRLRVTEAHFGQEITCPTCSTAFVVPDLSSAASPSDLPQVDTSAATRRAATSSGPVDLNRFALVAGRPMLAIGLILVLVSRGCDSIGARGVSRAQAKAQKVRSDFQDEWDEDALDLNRQIKALQEKKDPTPEDAKEETEIRKQLSDLAEKRRTAQQAKESGDWRDSDIAARNAGVNNRINRWWREIFFVFASVIFALGLLAVSWIGEGTERMVCLIMLAILTFSIYIGGIAWATFPDISEMLPPEVLQKL